MDTQTEKTSIDPWFMSRVLPIGIVVLFALALIFVLVVVPGMINNSNARWLCKEWANTVLLEVKNSPLEEGTYGAFLPVEDPWGNELLSTLTIAELANSVRVLSSGKDCLFPSEDDIVVDKTDIHVRKTIRKGLETGAFSVGKGLAQGVMEGVKDAGTSITINTKRKASELLSRFRKKETGNE